MSSSTQCDDLLALLRARAPAWVQLSDILALGIAQYNARIFELRQNGHIIEQKFTDRRHRKSVYRYVPLPSPRITRPPEARNEWAKTESHLRAVAAPLFAAPADNGDNT
jgi:hypothetical protein